MATANENEAANAYVNQAGYGGSVDALATKNAFLAGVVNQGTVSDTVLIKAFIAGLEFDRAQREALREKLTGNRSASPVAKVPSPGDLGNFYKSRQTA